MTIRLMLADDHRMLREGLRRSMSDQGFDVVGEARDGEEAECRAHRCSVRGEGVGVGDGVGCGRLGAPCM